MITDVIVLGLTLRKTFYVFEADQETREAAKVSTTLVYNGKIHSIFNISVLLTFCIGCSQFG